jgi:hypothetical protein
VRVNRNIVITALLAGFVGIGAGATVQPEPVVKTVTVEKTVEVKVAGPTLTIEVTPAVCLRALDLAGQGFGFASDGFMAVADDNVAALEAANESLSLIVDDYIAARDACIASSNVGS